MTSTSTPISYPDETHMQGRQVTVPNISSRRSACDRCKGQKLRCLREPGQERCGRCARADAECLTTPAFRIKYYSGDNNTGSGSRKRPRRDIEGEPDPIRDADQAIDTSLSGVFADPSDAPSTVAFPHGISESWDSPVYTSIFDDNFNGDLVSSVIEFDETNISLNTPVGKSLSSISQPNPSSTELVCLQEWDTSRECAIPVSSKSNTVTQDTGSNGTTEDIHIEQRLSKINLNLVTLLSRISQGPPTVTVSMLVSAADGSTNRTLAPIHCVLTNTREFVDILSVLSEANQPPTASQLSNGCPPRIRGPRSSNDACSPTSINENSLYLPGDSLALVDTSPLSTLDGESATDLDAPTLMLILTSYIHITRLYLIIFTHCHEFLESIARSEDAYLCPIPGINFSDFPLQSGNLQSMMFIQIVVNLFERMESLLGIPRQFRIGTRGKDNGGLLTGDDFCGVVRMMIDKEELVCQPELGKGGVKVLRKYIENSKRLLLESIAP
ncbi:uncharacterized protein F4822DRAFT_244055 [Hypoxylon trugodes]|uniref:uncharacterized protein n=1 Tax=Hypoxylon trugodes TaxID=326681 RepID=UPI00219CA496|nr:uncharacterized protein F4822DRAFT_244055 [Hypoxylon trugodes]KAI1388370.1 hypothetical protein F4822DRAFT_244055 [Hypoxylon trugodes]